MLPWKVKGRVDDSVVPVKRKDSLANYDGLAYHETRGICCDTHPLGNQAVLRLQFRMFFPFERACWVLTMILAFVACWVAGDGSPTGHGSARAAVTFGFNYQDVAQGTGQGFDDPNEGEARRQALEEVADQWVGQQLDHTASLQITVKLSEELSENALAQAGQNYTIRANSFQSGLVASHIQTGRNSSDGAVGSMTWDLSRKWHTGTDAPPKGHHDFRSVALHELTHLLGLSSLLRENGRGLQDAFFDTYASFDAFLENASGTKLVSSGRYNTMGGASLSDLTTAVYFDGHHANAANNGQRVQLFTPNSFRTSSLSHLDDRTDPLAHQLRIATTNRHWSLVDRGILRDLGYRIPDVIVVDHDEVLSSTTLDVDRSLYIGGDAFAAVWPGSLTIRPSATVNVNQLVSVWPEGTLTVDGSLSGSADVVNQGTVEGTGYITSLLRNESGTIMPGNSAGRLRVADFSQGPTGTLEVEIGGLTPVSQYDVLRVDNSAHLDGLLHVKTINNYQAPTERGTFDSFTIVEAGSIANQFKFVLYNDDVTMQRFTHPDGSFGISVGDGMFRNVVPTGSDIMLQNVAAVPGDTDGNMEINIVDFNTLAVSYAPHGAPIDLTWEQGDFDGDNDIDIVDFNALAVGFLQDVYRPSATSRVLIPEPNSACLLAGAGLALIALRGLRRGAFSE
ncbi:MAG: hypothetical protein MK179_11580 [Pirellulaceae bacterium]|nr:hypothetical protein [Pirellulaceae bacterium]